MRRRFGATVARRRADPDRHYPLRHYACVLLETPPPRIHGDRTYFADRNGDLPIIKGNLVRVQVERLPDGCAPHKTLWLWHAGPTDLALDEPWPAYLARFDEEHTFAFGKGTLGVRS
ncbi:hypothetical protein [Nonomuraea typhae]|uniref:Uncharacterized protein n=1 Tax=Nonomuraea typhae TaxID=2603600 RepID=A0ABW7YUY8_9ACTN